jgi:hypothetical protein
MATSQHAKSLLVTNAEESTGKLTALVRENFTVPTWANLRH